MKIAIISMIRDSWGGSEELWYEMAKVALSGGHQVMHLSYEHRSEHFKFAELRSRGLVTYKRPGITGFNSSGLARLFRLLINFIRKKIQKPVRKFFLQMPDVVLYNGTCYSIASEKEVLKELRNFRGRFYLLGHFNDRKFQPERRELRILQEVYQKCTKVFFTNLHDLRKVKEDLGLGLTNAAAIRNPVNLNDKAIVPFRSNRLIQMAMVGNLLTLHKGQDIVFNILQNETWKKRSWHLNVYGSGSDEDYLKQLCNKNNLADRISFHGKADDIRIIWQTNHILLMPSRMEGLPLVLVEAMLCGRPCVVTNVGGISEWVEEGKSGFIAEAISQESYEGALEKAWQRKDRWEEMGNYAHERALQLYDPNAGQTLLDLITK